MTVQRKHGLTAIVYVLEKMLFEHLEILGFLRRPGLL